MILSFLDEFLLKYLPRYSTFSHCLHLHSPNKANHMQPHPDTGIQKRFLISIEITLTILLAEVVGGFWTGSLTLKTFCTG